MSTSSRRPATNQPRNTGGQFTFARHDTADTVLLSREDATEEARTVFADAQARATQMSAHARRAGLNLLAVLAQAQDSRAETLGLRWVNGRYEAESITDVAGDILWSPASNGSDPISRTVGAVGAYIEEPGDAADSGLRVLTGGAATLPLTPSKRFNLDDLTGIIG